MLRNFLYSSAFVLAAIPAFASAQTYFPVGPQLPSVTIDAAVTHTATPDTLNVSISCPNSQTPVTRQELTEKFAEITSEIKTLIDGDGVIRKPQTNFYSAGYGMMPMPMDPTEFVPPAEDLYSGDLTLAVRNLKPTSAKRVAEGITELGCTSTWDARLVYTGKYLRQNLKDLRAQIAEKREAYEEALDQKLEKVGGMYSTTTIDSIAGAFMWPGGYDPETNTMDVVTSMSMTYILK